MMPDDQPINRRQFLRNAARYGAAGGLLAGMSLLVLGVTDKPAGRQRCIRPIACGGCDVFGSCSLPKAQLARGETDQEIGRGRTVNE